MQTQRALVLGATGGIGNEVARQLLAAGWQVSALTRQPPMGHKLIPGMEWMLGDVLDRAAVSAAAENCDVILHAVNPPGYRHWEKWVLPMLDNTLAAAAEQRACVLLPGTVYNFDPHNLPFIKEQAAQQPKTRKGKIRVSMEQRLQQFADAGGQAVVVRAGDYFGPGAGNNWFAQGLIKPGKPVRKIYNPARPGVGHQWGYLPDVAATMVQVLAQRQRLGNFTNLHMAGHWDEDGRQMVTMIQQLAQRQGSAARIAAFPWWLISLMAPFNLTLREMQEMRYLWQQPLRLDNTRLIELLGEEPHTPLEQAINDTLNALGCGV